jgi:hypothetical protein
LTAVDRGGGVAFFRGGLSEDVFNFLEERRIALRGTVFNFQELA